MAERMFDNRFRHGKCHFELAGTSLATAEMSGTRFEKVALDEEIGTEIVLKLTDLTPFAHELKQKRFALRLKSGVAQTSVGPVLVLLWWIPPITNGKPFALYEQILDPTHTGVLEMLRQLASQTHLHLLLIGPGEEILDVYEFQSTFGLEKLISVSESACKEHCGMDFLAAKEEYDRTYELMDLFRIDELGTKKKIATDSKENSTEMPERYRFDRKDRVLLTAASGLLKIGRERWDIAPGGIGECRETTARAVASPTSDSGSPTFTVRRGRDVFAPLAEAINRNPTLQVRLAVNVGRDGDFSTPEYQILTRFAEQFWQNHWPWPSRPCVYYDPRALSTDGAMCASLHAKCIVIDDEIAFVTSANFTEWAQERNLEAGVLVRDEGFARSLRNQFDALIAASRLRLLPGSAG